MDKEPNLDEIFDFIRESRERGHNLYLAITTTKDVKNIGITTNVDEDENATPCAYMLANIAIRHAWFKKAIIRAYNLLKIEERKIHEKDQ